MATHMTPKTPRNVAGFTLIDSMIAVVVLATGILALTLLQVSMLRSAAEARERSVAMTVAQNLLESERARAAQTQTGYQNLATAGQFASGSCDYATSTVAPNTSGLTTEYRYCVTVQRFRASGSTFASALVSGSGAPAYSGIVPEYKQLTVDVGWRKNDGSWGNLRLGDALSGIPLINSNDLHNRPITGGSGQTPAKVIYDEASLTQNTNFIPIAIGDGSGNSVAATNPTPKVIGGGVAETSFQVYTYSAAAGYANVQREVDTKVIGCSCTSRLAPSLLGPAESTTTETFLTRPVRPTYWNGSLYTEPKAATYPTTDLIGQENPSRVGQQSELCDVCCRDHVDPDSVDYDGTSTGEQDDLPRFDPYRAAHMHYRSTASDAAANHVLSPSQAYAEVCRVIRVNGIYRVSQDPLLDHYSFIPTDNDARDFRVVSATTGYKNFVQSYVEGRVLPLSGYAWDTNRVNVTALEASSGLNAQAAAAIDIGNPDTRYLQNRAILFDVLSYGAKGAIQDCIDQTGTGAPSDQACALRHTQFASINLTELTNWTVTRPTSSSTADPITVRPKNFSATTPTGNPVAGQVNNASGAIANTDANAVGAINRSIATLADDPAVFYQNPSSTLWFVQDLQPFHYVGGTLASVKIRITVAGLSAFFSTGSGNSSAPYIGWTNATTQGDCVRDGTSTTFVCDLYSTANATGVSLRMYNYYQNLTSDKNGASCGTGSSRVRADVPRCNVYRLSTVTPGITFTPPAFRTSATSGAPKYDEQSVLLGNVVDGGAYTVTFETSPSNPVSAAWYCDSLTGQPQLSFQESECRL